jgi:molybdopterin molybdotransferase
MPQQHILLDPFEAVQKGLSLTTAITTTENVQILDALGRVLANDVVCQKALPAFDNSAMDGYAVKVSDAGKIVKIEGTIFAGDFPEGVEIRQGTIHKIMTGAMVPPSCDAVVPFEKAEAIDEFTIKLPEKIKNAQHIRRLGEEINTGAVILNKGDLLTPSHLAVLASQGITTVPVFRKLRIGVLSTGSEIKEPWDRAEAYQIYNSNSTALYGCAKELGFDVSYLGAIPDDEEAIRATISGFHNYDVIITSGGVSVGEADFTAKVFKEEGMTVHFHGMALKPGKHALYGVMGETIIMGLPGNPLASLSVFMLFATPILAKRQGRKAYAHTTAIAKNAEAFSFKGRRANLILGTIKNGEFTVVDGYMYGSGMITPVTKSNAFIITKVGVEALSVGQEVKIVLPYSYNSEEIGNFYS